MKQRETNFKERVRKKLNAIPESTWVKIQQRALRGIPDFLGCVRGRCVALELKTEEGEAEPLQLWTLNNFKKAGAYTEVVRPSNLDRVIYELTSKT